MKKKYEEVARNKYSDMLVEKIVNGKIKEDTSEKLVDFYEFIQLNEDYKVIDMDSYKKLKEESKLLELFFKHGVDEWEKYDDVLNKLTEEDNNE